MSDNVKPFAEAYAELDEWLRAFDGDACSHDEGEHANAVHSLMERAEALAVALRELFDMVTDGDAPCIGNTPQVDLVSRAYVNLANRVAYHGDELLSGSENDLPFPDATAPDHDAENDPTLRDLETVCAWCGMEHSKSATSRACGCTRHIDGGAFPDALACNAAAPTGSEARNG